MAPSPTAQPYRGRVDLDAVLAFGSSVVAGRPEFSGGWHPGELAWAYQTQPASADTWLWRDGETIVAVASIDGEDLWVEAAPDHEELWEAAIGWVAERSSGLALRVRAFEGDRPREGRLAALGYARDAWEGVLFELDVATPPPTTRGPAGFRVIDCSAIDHRARVEAHRRAWDALAHIGLPDARSAFTDLVYADLRGGPGYDPQLDLVAISPEGAMAGACLAWLDAATGAAVFEPVGVDPVWRGRRLAGLMIHEGLRRLHDRGARTARIGTAHVNAPAIAAYTAAGAQVIGRSRWWRRR
jgi:ribosomal protein S18 acetylase RimI-like enzyme